MDLDSSRINLERLRGVLERSKQVSLELVIYVNALDEYLYSVLKPHIARARSLTFIPYASKPFPDYDDEDLNDIRRDLRPVIWRRGVYYLGQIMRGRFAQLEALKIEELDPEGDVHWEVEAPNLCYLRISNCRFTSNPISLHNCINMTTLAFDQSELFETIDEPLWILSKLPKLRRFIWTAEWDENHSLTFNSPHNFDQGSIHLPLLNHLELRIPSDIMVLVIPLLDIPLSTKLVIQGICNFYAFKHLHLPAFTTLLNSLQSAFLPYFQRVFTDSVRGYTSISILSFAGGYYDSDDGFHIAARHIHSSPISNVPDFDFGMQWDGGSADAYMDVVMQVLSWPGMARNVTALHVEQDLLMGETHRWHRLLREFPAVADVSVSGEGIQLFLRALNESASSPFEMLLALKTISFDHLLDDDDVLPLLAETLDKRVEAGQRELTMDLTSYHLDKAEVLHLKQHKGVKKLRWNPRFGSAFRNSESDTDVE